MATVVPEPLDVTTWPTATQQAISDELLVILGKPAPDYTVMTDAELLIQLQAIYGEMITRPGAVVAVMDSVELAGNHVVIQR